MMDVGFTSTRDGLSKPQLIRLAAVLHHSYLLPAQFHHGDCIGGDDEGAEMAYRMGYEVHGHPPINESRRAFNFYTHVWHQAKDYHPRNHDIVDSTPVTVGAPKDYSPEANSGTWATIRYAMKQGKLVYVFLPDGAMMTSSNGKELSWG